MRKWKEKIKFERMLEDHKKLLYPTCDAVSEKGFGELLKIQKKMLSKDNELPATMYEAKQVVYPLGLEIQKIHAKS